MSPTSRKRRRRGGSPARAGDASRRPSTGGTGSRGGTGSKGGAGAFAGLAELLPILPITDGLSHPRALQHPDRPVVRLLLGLVLVAMTYLVVPSAVFTTVLTISFRIRGGGDWDVYLEQGRLGAVPEGLLASNLGIASLIVVCWAAMRWVNLAPPGLVLSVVRRLRWGYLAACAGVALVVFVAIQAVSLLAAGTTLQPQPQFWWFVLVVVLTSPFQAAAEEVLFRGFLQQGIGSATRAWWLGVLLTSLLFALAHGTQSPALFVDRFVFGVMAGLLVWRTGGLEAAIGTHVVNNVLAFVLAGLTSSIAEVRALQVIDWPKAAVDLGTFAVIAAGCWGLARLWKLQRVTAATPGLGDRRPIR